MTSHSQKKKKPSAALAVLMISLMVFVSIQLFWIGFKPLERCPSVGMNITAENVIGHGLLPKNYYEGREYGLMMKLDEEYIQARPVSCK